MHDAARTWLTEIIQSRGLRTRYPSVGYACPRGGSSFAQSREVGHHRARALNAN